MVDHEDLDGSGCRFQFEPELRLQSLKERWSGRFRWRRRSAGLNPVQVTTPN